MPVAILRPNGDGAVLQFTPNAGTAHWDRVNDPEDQPTAPVVPGNYLSMASGTPKTEELAFETLAGVGSVSEVKLYVYSAFSMAGPVFEGSVFMGGVWQTQVTFNAAAAAAWYVATFAGAWTQADLDALQGRFYFSSGSPSGTLYATQAHVTYTAGGGPGPGRRARTMGQGMGLGIG